MDDFRKYATKHLRMNSNALDIEKKKKKMIQMP